MNIIFFGTPNFAARIAEGLVEKKHNIVAIVSAPDSKKGRGKKIKHTPVKKAAELLLIPVLQPTSLQDSNFIKKLKSFKAELFVVVAFRMLPEIVWKIPKKGSINLHTSLLPMYRGAAPINRVLINGEKKTGLTTFFINSKIDQGKIIMQEEIKLTKDITAGQLHNKLIKRGNKLLHNTINNINKINPTKQNNKLAISFAPKISKEELKIDWNKSAEEIHNQVRGLSPYIDEENNLKDVSICPSSWFLIKDVKGVRRIKLQLTKVEDNIIQKKPNIQTDNSSFLRIIIKDKALSILKLQPEGKKSMNIKDFLLGNKLEGDINVL